MSENKLDQSSTTVATTTSTKAGAKILAILGTLTVVVANINTIVDHAGNIGEKLAVLLPGQGISILEKSWGSASVQPLKTQEEDIVGTYRFTDINDSLIEISFHSGGTVTLNNGDSGDWTWSKAEETYFVDLRSGWTIEEIRLKDSTFSATQKAYNQNEEGPDSGRIVGERV